MNTATSVLRELGISEKAAVREYAMLNASQKAAEFEQECQVFESKYKLSFANFENELRSQKTEDFEREDDYLAWKFAVEGAAYWREKIELLQKES